MLIHKFLQLYRWVVSLTFILSLTFIIYLLFFIQVLAKQQHISGHKQTCFYYKILRSSRALLSLTNPVLSFELYFLTA